MHDIKHSTLSKMKLAEIVEAVLPAEVLAARTGLVEQLAACEAEVSEARVALNSSKTMADSHRAAMMSQVCLLHDALGIEAWLDVAAGVAASVMGCESVCLGWLCDGRSASASASASVSVG